MVDDARDLTIDLLLVCTANQARSPAAELLFRRQAVDRLGDEHGLEIRSAGVYAASGVGLLPTMADALSQQGLSYDDFRSRPLSAEEIDSSRLVITMTEEHRRAVNRMAPSAVARSYTLPELDRLVSSSHWDAAWDGADDLVDHLRRLRPLVAKPNGPEDVVDPAGHGVDVAVAVLDELRVRIARIGPHLFGTSA
jgi:protein-tyrosine phosphatase